MTTIVTRAGKGSALTHSEVDANFTNLNTYKVEKDANGNIGVGVTPSAWSSGKAIEIGQQGFGLWCNSSNDIRVVAGAKFASGAWLYSVTGSSVSRYDQQTGQHVWAVAPAGTVGNTITWTQAMTLDANSNLLLTGGGAIGYGTGSGGTVTQLTSKSTTVTLNRPSGRIIMSNAALAANTTVTFTLSNSLIGVDDVVAVCLRGGMASGATYQVWIDNVSSSATLICLRNISGGSLSEAINISFAVIKGATS